MTLRCYISVILITLFQNARADTIPDFIFHHVTAGEDKTFTTITGIVQDRQGYMWFATMNGLFRYDGYKMSQHKFNPLDSSSPGSNLLAAITIDSAGFIWTGTVNNGVERFDPFTEQFTHFRYDSNDPTSIGSDSILTMLTDHEGTVWLGTQNGLDSYYSKTNQFTHYRHQQENDASISSNLITTLIEDKYQILWIGTKKSEGKINMPGGLNRFDRQTKTFKRFLHNPNDSLSIAGSEVEALCETRNGTFWISTSGRVFNKMDRKKGTFIRCADYPCDSDGLLWRKGVPAFETEISFIHEDAGGGLWIGFLAGGLWYYNTGTKKFMRYASMKNLPGKFNDRNARAAFTSRDGMLWISSNTGHLYRIDPVKKEIPYYPSQQNVNGFYEDDNGTMWIGKEHGGLIHYDVHHKIIEQFKHDEHNPASLSDNRIRGIKVDTDGRLWVGTGGGGLEMFDRVNKQFIHYPHIPGKENSLSSGTVISLAEDSKKNIWVGTLYGLNRLHPATGKIKQFHFYPENTEEWNQNTISSVEEDNEGKIWAGCMGGGGLQLVDPETDKSITYLKGSSIESIFEDKQGVLWVGGFEGLFYYNRKDDRFVQFVDQFSSTDFMNIIAITEDDQQNIWAVTNNALIRINPKRNEVYNYGAEFGLSSFMNKWNYKAKDGTLYFTDLSGYYSFRPEQLWRASTPPEIIISDIRLAENKSPLQVRASAKHQIVLEHDQHSFSFEFAVIDFTNPQDNKHMFMLENYDRDWNHAGSDHRAIYFNVPPGEYTFKVKGMNSLGLTADKSVKIMIRQAFWNTWWFRISVLLAGMAFVFSVMRWRLKQKFSLQIERAEKEKVLLSLKQETAQLQMQALRAQMNPHFISNSLNSIKSFILDNDKDQASEYLTKFSRLVRLILHHSQSASIPLESELEALKLYLELERVRFDYYFDFNINIATGLDISQLKVPPLIIQPYAENAIWHGLMHKEEKGRLDIDLAQRDDTLYCKITDDGIGRKKASEMKSKSVVTYRSMGMQITADRIAILSKNHEELNISITDLVLPDGGAGGTQVELQIPLQYD